MLKAQVLKIGILTKAKMPLLIEENLQGSSNYWCYYSPNLLMDLLIKKHRYTETSKYENLIHTIRIDAATWTPIPKTYIKLTKQLFIYVPITHVYSGERSIFLRTNNNL